MKLMHTTGMDVSSLLAGHTHEVPAPTVRGIVQLDPQDWSHAEVRLEIDTAALTISLTIVSRDRGGS